MKAALLLLLAAAGACAPLAVPPSVGRLGGGAPRQPVATCSAHAGAAPAEVEGAPLNRVELEGLVHADASALCAVVRSAAGKPLDRAVVRRDVVALWRSGAVDDVVVERRLDGGAVVLRFFVRELPTIADVRIVGDGLDTKILDGMHQELGLRTGEPAHLTTLRRRGDNLRDMLFEHGMRHAQVEVSSAPFADGVQITYAVTTGPLAIVSSFDVVGGVRLGKSDVAALLPSLRVGAIVRDEVLRVELLRLQAYYYDLGMLNTTVDEPKLDERPDGKLAVTVTLHESAVFHLGQVRFAGKLAAPEADYAQAFAITSGAVFSRAAVIEARKRLQALHASRGGRGDVVPETAVDSEAKRVDLVWRFDP